MIEPPKCGECGSDDLVIDDVTGETICRLCGLVVDSKHIDPGPDWRSFNKPEEDKRARASASPSYLPTYRISSDMDWRDVDIHGSKLDPDKVVEFRRLRKVNVRVLGDSGRGLLLGVTIIRNMCTKLSLPKYIVKSAIHYFTEMKKIKAVRGRTLEDISAACIYVGCRDHRIPMTIGQISSDTGISKKSIYKSFKIIHDKIGVSSKQINVREHLTKYVSSHDLPPDTLLLISDLDVAISKTKIFIGSSPTGIASGIIYTACIITNAHRTQSEVALAFGITEVTLRNISRKFKDNFVISILL